MMAQWENECISLSVLSVARVQLPAVAKYFNGLFVGWSHTRLERSWEMGIFQGMFRWLVTLCQFVSGQRAENGSISPQWRHSTCGHGGGRLKSSYGQTIAKTRKLQRDAKIIATIFLPEIIALTLWRYTLDPGCFKMNTVSLSYTTITSLRVVNCTLSATSRLLWSLLLGKPITALADPS